MQKSCSCHAKKRASRSTCHAKTQAVPHAKTVRKNKLFVSCKKSCSTCEKTSCSTCKNRAKPCKKPTCQNDMSLCSRKNHAKTMQNAAHTERQPAEHPLPLGSLLYVLYVLYLTRQAIEHPLSPGSLLHVLYVLYLTRQATAHPLSPGSLLYVLYVLYLTRQATEHTLPGFLAICAICAIWYRSLYTIHIASQHVPNMPCIAHILHFEARTEYIAHIVHIARSWGRVGVQRLGV